MSRAVKAALIGIATLLVSFLVTNVAYIKWAVWRYPTANSMAGLSAFVLGLEVAPVCALVSVTLYLWLTKRAIQTETTSGYWPRLHPQKRIH